MHTVELDPRKAIDLPSVDVGPISIGKAVRLLDWKPTPMRKWLMETVRWNLDSRNREYTRECD